MQQLKLLFLRRNGESLVGAPNVQWEFEQVMGKYAKCRYAGEGFPDYVEGETMDETVQRVMPDADWVFDNDESYHLEKPRNKGYRVGVFISDLHGKHQYGISNPVEFANMIVKADYDGVFMRTPLVYGTPYRPEVFYEVLGDRAHWIPWSVNIGRYRPRKEKKWDVAFLGAMNNSYPMRRMICEGIFHVARGYKVLCREPPYGGTYDRTYDTYHENYIVGARYSEALGSSRILIFDCSKYRYPLLKFFEGGASGCMLMTDAPAMGKRLGFMPRETYTEIAAYNWEDGLRFFLSNPDEAEKISEPCTKMVRRYHNHDIRSRQLVEILENIQEG